MSDYDILFFIPARFIFNVLWKAISNLDTGDILLAATTLHCCLAWKNINTNDFYYHCVQTCVYGGTLALLCLVS